MTVITPDGLRLADADGNLLPTTIPDVKVAAWFPDSKRLLVSRQINAKTWDELTKYPEQVDIGEITAVAQRVHDALMAYDWSAPGAGDWQKFVASLNFQEEDAAAAEQGKIPPFPTDAADVLKEYGVPIGMFVRDHADAALKQKVPAERWKELAQLVQPVHFLEVYAVAPFTATPVSRLSTTLEDNRELRISPTGAAVIVMAASDQQHASRLWVLRTVPATDDQDDIVLSDLAASYPDWSPDGRDVVFIQAAQPAVGDSARLGSLTRVRVIGDDGALLTRQRTPEDLAGLMYDEYGKVRCLKDGRILFASAEVTLPATANDMPQRPQLFSLASGKAATVTRLLPAQAYEEIGNAAEFFEVSPDERFVSIPDKSGKVSVVDLQTGGVTAVQDKPVAYKDHNGDLLSVPQWRSNDELTVVAPGENGHPSVELWSLSKNVGKTLSNTWPIGITDADASSTQPTTSPSPASK
jgi:hypothetical protein